MGPLMRREVGVSGVGRDVAWGLGRDGGRDVGG